MVKSSLPLTKEIIYFYGCRTYELNVHKNKIVIKSIFTCLQNIGLSLRFPLEVAFGEVGPLRKMLVLVVRGGSQ